MFNRALVICLITVILLFLFACNQKKDIHVESRFSYDDLMKLDTLHAHMDKIHKGDWLASQKESGQNFNEYISSSPICPDDDRNKIYILPIGDFSDTETNLIAATAEYLQAFFNLEVVIQSSISDSIIHAEGRRKVWGNQQQLHTKYILSEILKPKLPCDAVCLMAITNVDLYPRTDWNFVFGQATIEDRVGVSSFNRYGDPHKSDVAFRKVLKRIIKTASHETGHMFSMRHCITYECNLNGSNSMEESDRKPVYLCPICMAKNCWCTGADPIERYNRLKEFFVKMGFDEEDEFCDKSIELLEHQLVQ